MAAPTPLPKARSFIGRALLAAGVATAAAIAGIAAVAAPDSPPETALADYVAAPDDSFSWRVHARYDVPGAEIVELRLVSQTWRGIEWRHRLHLVKPDTVGPDAVGTTSTQGFLFIGGGRWRDSYDTEVESVLPDDAAIFIELARRLQTVVAVVGQVPYQPIFGLREDELIAHTFVQYLETGDAEWPLLLPMVKAAVRAMDAAQAFSSQEWRVDLDRFTVSGGSKRGWTTWLAGAVDERVATLVPLVIDVLNFAAHMPHQKAAWGTPSEQIAPYTRRGLDDVFEGDAGAGLRRIVDPYSYRDRLTQPKLIVVGTNDEYFPLDSLNLYWDDLRGPKHVLYLPNQGHDAEDFARLIPAIAALHAGAVANVALPELEWGLDRRDDGMVLCVRASPAPSAVTVWAARSTDTDFRDERFAPREAPRVDDVFVFDVMPPAAGYQAIFAEALFEDDRGAYMLSTNVQLFDADGEAPFAATALDGRSGICPRR
jgi:PhoPQ-activated pathogenicity-related protein